MAELHYEKGKCLKEKMLLLQCLLDENCIFCISLNPVN